MSLTTLSPSVSSAPSTSPSTERFYSELRSFSDFSALSDDRHYEALPHDWFVVITDVRGSTAAIAAGRYQDVNMLGAASVAVLGSLWRDNGVPFVFGGDGASILVPPSRLESVKRELIRLSNLGSANYGLELRVGVVPMSQIAGQGLSIQVAKFAMGSAKPIAFMRGGGLAWADHAIKSRPDEFCVRDESAGPLGEVKDLSCRWKPLKSRRGKVLSILARSTTNDVSIYSAVLDRLSEILGGDVLLSSPVNAENMRYKSLFSILRSEMRMHSALFEKSLVKRLAEIFASLWLFKYACAFSLGFDRYRKEIPSHSDFRKFDDMLRLVLDCTPEQVKRIQDDFEALYREGRLYYGIHVSDHALMTCLVGSTGEGDHIHFIDGGDGGYALAAKSLKEQIAKASGGTLDVDRRPPLK
jgi:hypothetical protein